MVSKCCNVISKCVVTQTYKRCYLDVKLVIQCTF